MKRKTKILTGALLISTTFFFCYRGVKKINPHPTMKVGQKVDSLNGVFIYYNGGVDNVEERNLTADGYNLGLKYQCVEFVKRYYYEHYKHKMPDSYGHAKDFFDPEVKDGELCIKRDLIQFSNPSKTKPQTGDLVIFAGHTSNPYGHVAIVSKVSDSLAEVVQQNPGPFASSRDTYDLIFHKNKYFLGHSRILGWLRIKN